MSWVDPCRRGGRFGCVPRQIGRAWIVASFFCFREILYMEDVTTDIECTHPHSIMQENTHAGNHRNSQTSRDPSTNAHRCIVEGNPGGRDTGAPFLCARASFCLQSHFHQQIYRLPCVARTHNQRGKWRVRRRGVAHKEREGWRFEPFSGVRDGQRFEDHDPGCT